MSRRRFQPLVWPGALLAAGVVVGWLAELSVRSLATAGLYGMLRLVADLTLLIAFVWGVFAVVRIFRPARPRA